MYGHCRQKDFFWGALVGGTIATLSVLLFTTKKGKQLQSQIGDIYEEVEETVKDTFSDIKDKAEQGVEHAAKKAAHKSKDDHHKDSK